MRGPDARASRKANLGYEPALCANGSLWRCWVGFFLPGVIGFQRIMGGGFYPGRRITFTTAERLRERRSAAAGALHGECCYFCGVGGGGLLHILCLLSSTPSFTFPTSLSLPAGVTHFAYHIIYLTLLFSLSSYLTFPQEKRSEAKHSKEI